MDSKTSARAHRTGSRKIIKERKPLPTSPMRYPDRLAKGDDAQEDVATMRGYPSQSANQSVFSLITKAGSTTDFHRRFDEESSDSDGESIDKISDRNHDVRKRTEAPVFTSGDTNLSSPPMLDTEGRPSLPQLDTDTMSNDESMSQSMFLPLQKKDLARESVTGPSPYTTSVLDQVQAVPTNVNLSTKPVKNVAPHAAKNQNEDQNEIVGNLAGQLKNIFGFKSPEDVIAEYPCWLTQNVLLQGYMYITQYHICFYAYAPKRHNIVLKSGHLSKRGKQNPKYSRYWFQLKGDELSYRTDSSDPYFRSGNIDLRYGISASLQELKDKGKNGCKDFSIITPYREYFFRADSAASAREWVKQIQRVIFRSHNKGDSVKISMPIENIVDIEEAPVMDVAETIKIRVADADEGFAVFAVDEVSNEF